MRWEIVFFLSWYHIYFPFNLVQFIVQHCVLLDIEGTTTPLSFFSDVLFPYAHDNVGEHLAATYDSEEARNDINLLRSQVRFFCSHLLSSTLWYLFFCDMVHMFYRFPHHVCRPCIYRKMYALHSLCHSTLIYGWFNEIIIYLLLAFTFPTPHTTTQK